MTESSQPPKAESSTRPASTYTHPIAVATIPRLLPRQPDTFAPGDDFDLWESVMRIYLKDVPAREHLQYIVSFLSKEATKQFLACKLPLDATSAELWGTLQSLFSFHKLPAAAMERLYERRQKPNESVQEYAGVLRQLAFTAFPNASPEELEQQILRRFITGVGDPDTRSKFIRKPPSTLTAAIQKALDFEAIAGLQRTLEANVTVSTTGRHRTSGPQNSGHRGPSRWWRGVPRSQCSYCQRFGSRARACGHNRPRAVPTQGEYLLPTLSLTCVPSFPCILKGLLDKKPVEFLIDTGATCSILRHHGGDADSHASLVTAAGSRIPTYGKIRKHLKLGALDITHNFILAPITREAIIGMDILRKYGAQIDAANHQVTFSRLPAICATHESSSTPRKHSE